MIFVGTILFSFSLFGKIIGACMLANAGFNIYVLIKYPQYDDAQRKDAQSEITDYLGMYVAVKFENMIRFESVVFLRFILYII